ncbi:MAG TPA: NAD(P)-dependent oxidoreductase [Gaiellaceae bacterium]|nr:NAD(P)-dependent oxidoreductase [Gaiellaceae bacterium]
MSAAPLRVSLVGLGHMGIPIGERLLEARLPLTVFNRTSAKALPLVERGAEQAPSAAGLLAETDVCITMLADDAALDAVTGGGGVLEGARPDTVLVDMSTVSVAASARAAAAAERAGVHFLRATVSGNPVVVRAGNLTIIVSGPRDAYARVEDVIRAVGPNVYWVGGADEARVVKLALQVMIAGTAQLMSEALALGEAGGVSREVLLEVMGNSAAGSPFVKYKTEPLLRDDYAATFTTSMMLKDTELVREQAAASGLSLPLVDLVDDLLRRATADGYGELDFMALYLALRGVPPESVGSAA